MTVFEDGAVTCVVASEVAPLVSSSETVIGVVKFPGPMIVAPDASFAVTVSVRSVAVPSTGDAFESASETEPTIGFSVTSSGVVLLTAMPAVTCCVESGVPLPSVLAYSEMVNASWPIGALMEMLHCNPFEAAVQFEDDAVSCTTVCVPPFTAIPADCVLAETYRGLRLADCACAPGTVIVNFAMPFFGCVVGSAAGAASDPPPPPHDESATAAISGTAKFRTFFKRTRPFWVACVRSPVYARWENAPIFLSAATFRQ